MIKLPLINLVFFLQDISVSIKSLRFENRILNNELRSKSRKLNMHHYIRFNEVKFTH